MQQRSTSKKPGSLLRQRKEREWSRSQQRTCTLYHFKVCSTFSTKKEEQYRDHKDHNECMKVWVRERPEIYGPQFVSNNL